METPKYLFKILSIANWRKSHIHSRLILSDDDKDFIHFSTEEQLPRIIEKFWSNVIEFVVLKLNVSKLIGKLVLEANPGGSNMYYHLYEAVESIPFQAIEESRIIQRHPMNGFNEREITKIGHEVLRQQALELSVEQILSPEIQALIAYMRDTMRKAPGVGLAAPQVGVPLQLIVIEDRAEYHINLTQEQMLERERSPVAFHVVINPKISLGEEKVEFFEGCLSIPEIIGKVPRSREVTVECLNEKGEQVVIHAKGWYARILQHEIDHVNGVLFIDLVDTRTLTTRENYNSKR